MFGTIGFKWYSRIYKKRSQLLINEYSWLRLVTKMLEPLSPPKSPVSRKIYRTFLFCAFK
nr:MAG TPA: hypothetical protein [Caudoviricetes sp.]